MAIVPDETRAAGARLDEEHPSQNQGAHDALAELNVGDQQGAKFGWRKQQRFNGLGRARIDQGGSAGELRDFGDKFACTHFDDFPRAAKSIASLDGYPTCNDDEHARWNLACPE